MSRNLSNNAKRAVFSQQTDEVFIVLLTINHPSFIEPARVSSDPFELLSSGARGVISNGIEYPYLPFTISLPQQDDTGTARATLSIDNIDRRIVAAARGANSSLDVKIEIVLASDLNAVEMSIDKFKLEKVTYDAFTVSGELSVQYFDLEPFPSKRFTPSDFPGMF